MNVALHNAARVGDLAALKQMIAEGADINDRGPSKYSLLIAATIGGDVETVRWLLDNGATVESLNPDDSKNALHYVALAVMSKWRHCCWNVVLKAMRESGIGVVRRCISRLRMLAKAPPSKSLCCC